MLATQAHAQAAARAQDTARAVARLDASLVRQADVFAREVWPGFRYDSVGLMYMVAGVAKLAVRWPGEPPGGMRALTGVSNAWWADTGRVSWASGLAVAYVAIGPGSTRGQLLALALHEAFHAYAGTQARDGRRFGRGENSLLTARYPQFDVENEAHFMVEAALLVRAHAAPSMTEARRLAAQYLAVRRARQARLPAELADYEKLAELHEGLAQYAYLRGLAVLAERDPTLRVDAERELQAEAAVLERAGVPGVRSIRRRFYATGSLTGLLLDRLGVTDWKLRLQRDDAWLQDVLSSAAGEADISDETARGIDQAMAHAVRAAGVLARSRERLRDSLLSRSGMRIQLSVATANVNWCFIDPQNLLSTAAGQILHTRVVTYCAGGKQVARFEQPVVEDPFTRTYHSVASDSLVLTVQGRAQALPMVGEAVMLSSIELQAPGVLIKADRAVLVRGTDKLQVSLY